MVRRLILIIMIVLFIGVPCGTHAAVELDADDNGAVDIDKGGWNSVDGSYDGPITIGGTGDSWLELLNNTSLVDDITGKYGIRFSNGVLQQIINGTPSSIGGGGASITEVAATPDPGTMVAGDLYIAQDDGELSYLLADSSEVFRYASTSSTALFAMTLGVVSDGSITINGTAYTSVGSPHTILALTGATTMTALYGGTNDTLVWSGTDSGDVTGTYPTYSITMNAAKSIIGTFSEGVSGGSVGSIIHTSTNFISASSIVYMSPGTATAGTVQYAHVYFTGGTQRTICVSIKDSNGDVLASGSATSEATAGWGVIDFVTPIALTAIEYHLAISSSTGVLTIGASELGVGSTLFQTTTTCDTSEVLPSQTNTKNLAIYVDNNITAPE